MAIDYTLIAYAVGAALVIIGFIILRRSGYLDMSSGKKSIMVIQPASKRFFDLPITRETENTLEAKRRGIPHRYFKSGPAWSGDKGVTRFLGIEGNAYTAIVTDDSPAKTLRLSQALKILWGNEYYDKKLPNEQKQILEHHVFGVTVQPDAVPITDKKMTISAENVDKENIKMAMDALGKNIKKKGKTDWNQILLGFAGGALIVWIAANMHWIRVA